MTFKIDIEENLQRLLAQEDTDGDRKITVDDHGPQRFNLVTVDGLSLEVSGTYYLSNLLQELVLARESGKETAVLNSSALFENPVDRTSRMIRDYFWPGLTRSIDVKGLRKILSDSKAQTEIRPIIYVPHSDQTALTYYRHAAAENPELNLQVVQLPENITPDYVLSINDKPGILSLALKQAKNGQYSGVPFVVPGGRFNEMYGWDSYFEALGLLVDNRVSLARAMVDNFVYQITHYGKILNANRSYYLTRSQPPFLTSMILAVYEHLPKNRENKAWLTSALQTAIYEYHTVWMSGQRLTETGLSRYCGNGIGMIPEAEPTHFDAVLRPFSKRAGIDLHEYRSKILSREIVEPELETYFMHDRAVRESGHDTSYRLEDRCASLNTIDLNSLLYKYEIDIGDTIKNEFADKFPLIDGRLDTSAIWYKRAADRKKRINDLLWNREEGTYYDYDFERHEQTGFESAASLYPLWAKLASDKQAESLVAKTLPLLEAPGGIAGSTAASRGAISKDRPQRQWDYPFGWAPHQMLIWQGLRNYGYNEEAQRLAYRWLYMITRNAADYNGTIPEKYDVVQRSHKVFAEYGNVGTDFDYISREGFGWMNASYQVGLGLLSPKLKKSLKRMIPAEWVVGVAPVK